MTKGHAVWVLGRSPSPCIRFLIFFGQRTHLLLVLEDFSGDGTCHRRMNRRRAGALVYVEHVRGNVVADGAVPTAVNFEWRVGKNTKGAPERSLSGLILPYVDPKRGHADRQLGAKATRQRSRVLLHRSVPMQMGMSTNMA